MCNQTSGLPLLRQTKTDLEGSWDLQEAPALGSACSRARGEQPGTQSPQSGTGITQTMSHLNHPSRLLLAQLLPHRYCTEHPQTVLWSPVSVSLLVSPSCPCCQVEVAGGTSGRIGQSRAGQLFQTKFCGLNWKSITNVEIGNILFHPVSLYRKEIPY